MAFQQLHEKPNVYVGSKLEDVLLQIEREHGIVPFKSHRIERRGGIAGFFAKEVHVVEIDPPGPDPIAALLCSSDDDELELHGLPGDEKAPAPGIFSPPASSSGPNADGREGDPLGQGTTDRRPFAEVLKTVVSSLGDEPSTSALPTLDPVSPAPRRDGPASVVAPGPTTRTAPMRATPMGPARAHDVPSGPNGLFRHDAADGVGVPPRRPEPVPDARAIAAAVLRQAGFPAALAAQLLSEVVADGSGSRPILETIFATLPAPPPLPKGPGGLVALVGHGPVLRAVATSLCDAVGCPVDEIAALSTTSAGCWATLGHRARTPSKAAALAVGWRRAHCALAAVAAAPIGSDQAWTKDVLVALRPSCAWAIVPATVKTSDLRRFLDAIGGADALVVVDAESTTTPCELIELGVPVARFDRDEATPARWARLVSASVARI